MMSASWWLRNKDLTLPRKIVSSGWAVCYRWAHLGSLSGRLTLLSKAAEATAEAFSSVDQLCCLFFFLPVATQIFQLLLAKADNTTPPCVPQSIFLLRLPKTIEFDLPQQVLSLFCAWVLTTHERFSCPNVEHIFDIISPHVNSCSLTACYRWCLECEESNMSCCSYFEGALLWS